MCFVIREEGAKIGNWWSSSTFFLPPPHSHRRPGSSSCGLLLPLTRIKYGRRFHGDEDDGSDRRGKATGLLGLGLLHYCPVHISLSLWSIVFLAVSPETRFQTDLLAPIRLYRPVGGGVGSKKGGVNRRQIPSSIRH